MSNPRSSKSKLVQGIRIPKKVPLAFRKISSSLVVLEKFKEFTITAIEEELNNVCDITSALDSASDAFYTDEDTDDCLEDEFDKRIEHHDLIENTFKQTSLRSFVLILVSRIECSMNMLCEVAYSDHVNQQKQDGYQFIDISYKDFKGNGIDRAKHFLKKILKRSLPTDGPLWKEIATLRLIRNTIIHKDGVIDSKDINQTLKKHIELKRLSLDPKNQILLEEKYINFVLPKVVEWFEEIESIFSRLK